MDWQNSHFTLTWRQVCTSSVTNYQGPKLHKLYSVWRVVASIDVTKQNSTKSQVQLFQEISNLKSAIKW